MKVSVCSPFNLDAVEETNEMLCELLVWNLL